MFGATFNLVYPCPTNVIFGTLTDGSLDINSLALNNCFSQWWSESGLGLGLNGWVRVRVRTRVRTRTLPLWTRTRTRTRTPPLWTRTQALWTRTLVLWTRTRTRTPPSWTRTQQWVQMSPVRKVHSWYKAKKLLCARNGRNKGKELIKLLN